MSFDVYDKKNLKEYAEKAKRAGAIPQLIKNMKERLKEGQMRKTQCSEIS